MLLLGCSRGLGAVCFDFETGKAPRWETVAGEIRVRVLPASKCGAAARVPDAGKRLLVTDRWRGGVLESPVFSVTGGAATFLLGGSGGRHAYVSLHAVGGEELRRQAVVCRHPAKGGDPWQLKRIRWDLSALAGRRVFLRVVSDIAGYELALNAGGSNLHESWVVFDAFRADGQLDPAATARRRAAREEREEQSLRAIRAELDDVVFAVRRVDRDPHWYANIGHWSGDPERKLYHEGARLCRLDVKTGQLHVLLDDPRGGIRDPQVHYDGEKVLFCYRPGGTAYYHLYEIAIDGTGMTRLTDGPYDDIEPTYLADGRIMFVSTRCKRWVPCYFTEVATLHACRGDGSEIECLSPNVEQENTPWPLPDGRVLYTRWEYVERNVMHFHHLWTTNPDGTRQTIFYGNLHPGYVMIDAKPLPLGGPGTSTRPEVVCVFSPGHGRTEHAGTIMLVDPSDGPDVRSAVRRVGWTRRERDPYPVGDGFLYAQEGTIGLMDRQGRAQALFKLLDAERKSGMWCHEPRPVRARSRERLVAPQGDPSIDTGRLVLANVRHGRRMQGIEPGEIKELLVLEFLPKPINISNGSEPTGMMTHNLQRILGTVPVEADGSAHFEVPARRNLFLAALDKDGRCIKRMQSFLTVQPGEVTACVGCHEHRTEPPGLDRGSLMALRRPASRIRQIDGVPEVFDYPRDIQPIWDRHCVACHGPDATADGGPAAGRVLLTGDHGPVWSHSYRALLPRWVRLGVVKGPRLGNEAPRAAGSGGSTLMAYLDGNHHGATLTAHEQDMVRLWIDSGAAYAGTHAAEGTGMIYSQFDRQANRYKVGTYDWMPMGSAWPDRLAAARDVCERRCNACHQGSLPELDITRDVARKRPSGAIKRAIDSGRILNLTRPEKSLLLLAPLEKSAGGHGRCTSRRLKGRGFESVDDPDYGVLLAYVRELHDVLKRYPRFDMPGFRPSPHYVREMKRYGFIAFDQPPGEPLDAYALDEAYWRSFWYRPTTHP